MVNVFFFMSLYSYSPFSSFALNSSNSSQNPSGSSTGILYVYSCEKGYNDDVLKYGDQVVSVDGKAVTTKAEVKSIISEHAVGDKVTFTIIRDGRTMDVEVTLYEYVPSGSVSFNN